MVDTSWDNGGQPSRKPGLGTGMKVLMGCGIALLLGVGTCVGGGLIVGRMIRKDPEGFGKRMEGWVRGRVQKDWDRLRTLVDQFQTDEGTRAVYRANPDLKGAYGTEELFLKAVQGWRPKLSPLPADVPLKPRRHRRRHGESPEAEPPTPPQPEPPRQPSVSIRRTFGGSTLDYRYLDGPRLVVVFHGDQVHSISVD